MPSISTISELTYSNWGPLTTTFTPAPSCTAKPQNVILGIASEPGIEFASVSCQSPDLAGCLPTGSHTTTPAPTSTRGLNPIDVYQASYFSPGIHCPAGWDTVGVASRKGNASVASDGAFRFSTSLPKTIWDATNIGPANGLMQILDPSETAVLCCHSYVHPSDSRSTVLTAQIHDRKYLARLLVHTPRVHRHSSLCLERLQRECRRGAENRTFGWNNYRVGESLYYYGYGCEAI